MFQWHISDRITSSFPALEKYHLALRESGPLEGLLGEGSTVGLVIEPTVSDVKFDEYRVPFAFQGKSWPTCTLDGEDLEIDRQENINGWTWYDCTLPIGSAAEPSFFRPRLLEVRSGQGEAGKFFFPTVGNTEHGPAGKSSKVLTSLKHSAIFYLLIPQIFLLCLLLLSASTSAWLSFPQALLVSATPILAGLLGERFSRGLSGAKFFRNLVTKQIRYPVLVLLSLGTIFAGGYFYYDDYRCKFISYRYNNALERLVGSANRIVDPVQEFAHLYQIAPDRRENLIVLQHFLWRVRYDDAFARVVSDQPVGFKRADLSVRFLSAIGDQLTKDLERGADVSCGCVEPSHADDPRLVWFHAKVESLSDVGDKNLDEFKALRDYVSKGAWKRHRPIKGIGKQSLCNIELLRRPLFRHLPIQST